MGQIRGMFLTLRCLHQPCVRRRTSTTTSSDVKVRRPVLNLLKVGNRALESVGFMMQRAPRRLLPAGHHSNDLMPLPTGTLPDDDALLRNYHVVLPLINLHNLSWLQLKLNSDER